MEETRVAILGIIIEDNSEIDKINELLHDASEYIVGRMGIPYREKAINIICVVVDAQQDFISTLSGRIGRVNGVSCKVTYSK